TDLGHSVVVELGHLLHLLGDRLPRLGDIGERIGLLTLQPRARSFELEVAWLRDQASLHQRLDVFLFLFHGRPLRPIRPGFGVPAWAGVCPPVIWASSCAIFSLITLRWPASAAARLSN